MLDFSIEIKDLKKTLKGIQDEMEAALIKEYQDSLKKNAGSIRYEIHKKRPRNVVKGGKHKSSRKILTHRAKPTKRLKRRGEGQT